MVTKRLITLKRIAEELKLNYNTLISCKKYFEEYLIVKNIGRTPKYPDAYIDFFRLVFALKKSQQGQTKYALLGLPWSNCLMAFMSSKFRMGSTLMELPFWG